MFFFTEIHGNIYLVVVKIVVGQHLKPEHLVRFCLTFNDHNWDAAAGGCVLTKRKHVQTRSQLGIICFVLFHAAHIMTG